MKADGDFRKGTSMAKEKATRTGKTVSPAEVLSTEDLDGVQGGFEEIKVTYKSVVSPRDPATGMATGVVNPNGSGGT